MSNESEIGKAWYLYNGYYVSIKSHADEERKVFILEY